MAKASLGDFIDYHAAATEKDCHICNRKFRKGESIALCAGKWIEDAPCYCLPSERDFSFWVGNSCLKKHVPTESIMEVRDADE